jgi:hypothetical protein
MSTKYWKLSAQSFKEKTASKLDEKYKFYILSKYVKCLNFYLS